MAWDFSTEPEFEEKLRWMRDFVREEVFPLEVLDADPQHELGSACAQRWGKRLPFLLALFKRFPILRRLPARMIGLGFRPEHIHTPNTNSGR